MISYENGSLFLQNEMVTTSKLSLQLIEKLDKKVYKLCKKLDKKLSETEKNTDDFEEIALIRKAVEIITVRKVQLAVKNYDFIDQNIRMVDNEIGLLEKEIKRNEELRGGDANTFEHNVDVNVETTTIVDNKKRKHSVVIAAVDDDASASADESDSNDPNEVFCTCRRVSFGDMVACDNEKCAIEWFHYGCVNLQKKPRNAWLCPDCTALQSIAT